MTVEQYWKACGFERKKWKRPEQITEHDYSFAQLKDVELPYAWLHEMDREIGNESTAWLDQSPKERIDYALSCKHIGDEIIEGAVTVKPWTRANIQWFMRRGATLSGLYFLRVNWNASDKEIAREFMDAIRRHKPTASAREIYEKRGRQHDYRAWFRNLAIYRLKQQYNAAQIAVKIPDPNITRQKVSQALKSIEKRIRAHVVAHAASQGIEISRCMSDK